MLNNEIGNKGLLRKMLILIVKTSFKTNAKNLKAIQNTFFLLISKIFV
jgi:hypothetical protein